MSDVLRIRSLSARYGKVEVLHDVDIDVEEGNITTVIGPNGAGKSTLLNAVGGLMPVCGGDISYRGSSILRLGPEDRSELGISLVTENRDLFGTMCVEDNLLLGSYRCRKQHGYDRPIELKRMYALFPRLEERKSQLANTLSGGERQMLALARALIAKPRLLMLDEPSLGLAPLVVQEALSTIGALRSTGVAVILVEQNARAALAIADQAYVLETGAVTIYGDARTLAQDQRVVESYLGSGALAGVAYPSTRRLA